MRILILGCCGNGKSTFARKLSEKTGLPVVHMDQLFRLPRRSCLWGVLHRYPQYHGRTRSDMTDECPERLDWDFLRYTWDFKATQGDALRQTIRESGKPCVVFRSHRQAEDYLNRRLTQESNMD